LNLDLSVAGRKSLTYAQSPDDKKKGTDTPSTSSVPASPGPIVNQLDDSAKETFATGRPLEDTPKIQQCRHCKKSILNTAITAHVIACLKAKKEKAQRKKEQKEAREREKKGIDADGKKDEDGDARMDDDDDAEEDPSPEKKISGGLKSAKKSAGKKLEIDDTKKGKKRKADGDAEKGPKQKKKKEEPKPKAPKPKGIYFPHLLKSTPQRFSFRPFYDDCLPATRLSEVVPLPILLELQTLRPEQSIALRHPRDLESEYDSLASRDFGATRTNPPKDASTVKAAEGTHKHIAFQRLE
jgi:hypothetical protein